MTTMIAEHYQILEVLGSGGMGDVYRGLDTRNQQLVAIKQLKSEVTTPEMVERFVREGTALRELNHPNIVKMLDAIEQGNTHYLVMEYVSGGDLSHLIDPVNKLAIDRILNIAIDLADALTRAHRLDIIHRDLKPANILIADDGTIRLTDFGVARIAHQKTISQADNIYGTLAYLPPEALSGEGIDTRADIWAFGIMLFEMLVGQRPFTSDQVAQIILKIMTEPIPALENLRDDIPIALADLVYRMLEKDPQSRISSVRLVGAELEAILKGDNIRSVQVVGSAPTADKSERFRTQALSAAHVQKHNLPIQTTAFVGRDNELLELETLLKQSRLVTILAPGGMGKTRLSIEMGKRYLSLAQQSTDTIRWNFKDGIYFIDLAPLTDPKDIILTIADAMGYPLQEDGREPKQQVLDYLQAKSVLLIMDNFEHLMSGTQIVTDILVFAPELKILATSRQRLNQTAEVVFNLQGLDVSNWQTLEDALTYSAIRLFIQSSKRIQPSFDLEADDLRYVARICQMVDGVPLGIILAAAWIDMLSLQEIVKELEGSLDFLETEMTDIPERQRSIRAVFDYSWNLMPEAEQQAFMKLAVFRGGMTREAAQSVTSAGLMTLRSLVAKSLITRDTNTGRYKVHELLRQFAEERLKNFGNFEATHQAHAAYFAEWIAAMEVDIKGQQQIAGLQHIATDFENVQRAWHWATQQQDTVVLNQLIDGVFWYCRLHNAVIKGAELFHLAQGAFPLQATATAVSGRLAVRFPAEQQDPLQVYQQGLEIAQREANQAEIAFCLQQLGRHHVHILANFDLGYPMQNESLKIYQGLNRNFEAAHVLDEIAFSYAIKGDEAARIQYGRQSLALRQQIGDKIGAADALLNIGSGEYSLNNFATSEDYIEQSIKLYKETGSLYGIAMSDAFLGMVLIRKDDAARVRSLAEQALKIAEDVHHVYTNMLALYVFGNLDCVAGNYQKATRFFDEAQSLTDDPVMSLQINLWRLASLIGLEKLKDASTLWQEISKDEMVLPLSTYGYVYRSLTIILAIPQMVDTRAVESLSVIQEYENLLYIPVHKLPFFQAWQDKLAEKLSAEAYQAAWGRGKSRQLADVFAEVKQEFMDNRS